MPERALENGEIASSPWGRPRNDRRSIHTKTPDGEAEGFFYQKQIVRRAEAILSERARLWKGKLSRLKS